MTSHGAAAACHLGDSETVRQVHVDFEQAPISEKLKRLLVIAGQVQRGGKQVSRSAVEAARQQGATDREIHDTVLIAAAFCMYNRYVDGLATWQPHDEPMYAQMGAHLAREGYTTSSIRSSS
jgi:alkylhydroperoxidase family enzyme